MEVDGLDVRVVDDLREDRSEGGCHVAGAAVGDLVTPVAHVHFQGLTVVESLDHQVELQLVSIL
jgi:hypothetical protein